MKSSIKLSIILLATSALAFFACKDESLNPVPTWETGVHGFATVGFVKDSVYSAPGKTKSKIDPTKDSFFIASAKKNWLDSISTTKPNRPYRFDYYWQSIDKQNTATKVEFFVYWDENYVDANGNSKIKRHGGYTFDEPGKAWKVISAPKASREIEKLSITQADIATLYSGVARIDSTSRTAASPFTTRDIFHITWAITTADGRKFTRWDINSICAGEILGANCQIDIPVTKTK